MTKYSEEEIGSYIDRWAGANIAGLTFREHQKEAVTRIITNIVNDTARTQITEAPTGSGKSIIIIIAAGVLSAEPFNMKSYILCSDLSLWEQYASFIDAKGLPFGHIKGKKGNYTCHAGDCPVEDAECRMDRMSWEMLADPGLAASAGWPCAHECLYVKERARAVKAKVTLMTYQLFMNQMARKSRADKEKKGFSVRDVIFCDECHNIPSIVQGRFSPAVTDQAAQNVMKLYDMIDGLERQYTFMTDECGSIHDVWRTRGDLSEKVSRAVLTMKDMRCGPDHLKDALGTWRGIICDGMAGPAEPLMKVMRMKRTGGMSKETEDMYALLKWYGTYSRYIQDFTDVVNETGIDYVVRQLREASPDGKTGEAVTFNCVKEDFLTYRYLMDKSKYRVLLSATVGDRATYTDNIGMEYLTGGTAKEPAPVISAIPSTFDFSRSPVYVMGKWNMSYRDKHESFPKIRNVIYELCGRMKGMRGIIQTGSYADAREIFEQAPYDVRRRMLVYDDPRMKDAVLDDYRAVCDRIIIGPTLNEGLDLPGDLCSFIIISKVPYPSLNDAFVKRKMELFPGWYRSFTADKLIQGIGRGNRFREDRCVTFILDGCFRQLYEYTSGQFPQELKTRLKFI